MALVFHDDRLGFWQFAHLMAFRLGIFSQQQHPAILTHSRYAFDDLIHFLRCFQLPPVPVMPFLSPFFLPTRLWLRIVPLLQPVVRGRFGRVVRIPVHLLLQSRHLAISLPICSCNRAIWVMITACTEMGVRSQSSWGIDKPDGRFISSVYF